VTADFVVWSGHKMYAPFGAGVLIGPREAFTDGDPFLAGGGAVELVDLDEVMWTDPPKRLLSNPLRVLAFSIGIEKNGGRAGQVGSEPAVVGRDGDVRAFGGS
jgi:selenocysteine lyase/cysteine desulfurase